MKPPHLQNHIGLAAMLLTGSLFTLPVIATEQLQFEGMSVIGPGYVDLES